MAQKKRMGFILALMVVLAGWLYYEHTSVFDANTRIEAEWGVVSPPLKIVQDGNLSGDSYIQSSRASGRDERGTAVYQFRIEQDGIYKIKAKAYSHANNGNSFYVKIDDQPEVTWDLGTHYRRWSKVFVTQRNHPSSSSNRYPVEIELAAGTHTMIVRERESRSGLDYFEFELVRPVAAAGFLSGVALSQFVQGALALCLVALSLTVISRVKSLGLLEPSKPVDTRLATLEKRLGDMQEVIISLDEKLGRMENRFEHSSAPELAEKD